MIDFAAIKEANNGHSFFAPSGSAMWLTCEDSLMAGLGVPDNSGEDAAYGTVGHDLAEKWLNSIKVASKSFRQRPAKIVEECCPDHLLDTVVMQDGFEIERDADMFAYVREYVEWCAALPGDHYIEQRVDFSDLTPIDGQTGTADSLAAEPGLLTVTDLKMGKGVRVTAADDLLDSRAIIDDKINGNSQLLIYAYGAFQEWDWLYDFQYICIRIAMPRLDIWETWETTREELLNFAEFVKRRAKLCLAEERTRTPTAKGCQWCNVRGSCAARLAWWHEQSASRFDDLDIDGSGVISGVSYSVVQQHEAVQSTELVLEPVSNPVRIPTVILEQLLLNRKVIERWLNDVELELEARANTGEELKHFKMVESRGTRRKFIDLVDAVERAVKLGLDRYECFEVAVKSPAQMEEALHAKLKISTKKAQSLLAGVVIKPPGRRTLALDNDKRLALPSRGDVFDDL